MEMTYHANNYKRKLSGYISIRQVYLREKEH